MLRGGSELSDHASTHAVRCCVSSLVVLSSRALVVLRSCQCAGYSTCVSYVILISVYLARVIAIQS